MRKTAETMNEAYGSLKRRNEGLLGEFTQQDMRPIESFYQKYPAVLFEWPRLMEDLAQSFPSFKTAEWSTQISSFRAAGKNYETALQSGLSLDESARSFNDLVTPVVANFFKHGFDKIILREAI